MHSLLTVLLTFVIVTTAAYDDYLFLKYEYSQPSSLPPQLQGKAAEDYILGDLGFPLSEWTAQEERMLDYVYETIGIDFRLYPKSNSTGLRVWATTSHILLFGGFAQRPQAHFVPLVAKEVKIRPHRNPYVDAFGFAVLLQSGTYTVTSGDWARRGPLLLETGSSMSMTRYRIHEERGNKKRLLYDIERYDRLPGLLAYNQPFPNSDPDVVGNPYIFQQTSYVIDMTGRLEGFGIADETLEIYTDLDAQELRRVKRTFMSWPGNLAIPLPESL